MLAAFPPPGLATPVGTPKSGSRWPAYESSLRGLQTPLDSESPKRGRRCCGMPLCWFLILLTVLLLVIAAAIVVPLELLVLNKKRDTANLSALEVCERDSGCNNGGQSIFNGGVCSCICVNNFTGTSCDDESAVGCTTVSFTSASTTYSDVTIGASIPDLVNGATADYDIPLEFAKVVSRFSDADLSCDAQNAIVSFNPGAAVSESAVAPETSKTSAAATTGPTSIVSGTGDRRRRGEEAHGRLAPRTEGAPSATSTSPTKSSSSATATSTPTPLSSSSATSNFTVTDDTLDFSRTAVLYILQTLSLDAAALAQTRITSFLVGNAYGGAANVTVGEGVSVDFLGWGVDAGAGLVGGRAVGGLRVEGASKIKRDGRGMGGMGEFGVGGLRGRERRLTGQRRDKGGG